MIEKLPLPLHGAIDRLNADRRGYEELDRLREEALRKAMKAAALSFIARPMAADRAGEVAGTLPSAR